MATRVLATNRKATHDYDVLRTIEAGIVLTGTEIKSIRAGRVNLRDSFARPRDGELWLHNVHIATYPQGGVYNHDPYRPRKLLLHKDQLAEVAASASREGNTLVPLRLYIKGHYAKLELAVARGRKKYDKRRAIAEREADRQMRRAVRRELGK